MRLLFLIGMALFASVALGKGYDGAGAPGGQQAGGAPMADKDGDLGWQEGKPSSVSGASSTPASKGTGKGQGQGGKGRGDGSGPWGSKGAMGGQSGKGLK